MGQYTVMNAITTVPQRGANAAKNPRRGHLKYKMVVIYMHMHSENYFYLISPA
jgi:hypothetical protein